MALFIELTVAHQNFSPTFGQRIHHIQGGEDQMALGTTPYYHEIIYGDVYENSLNSPESNDNPQKFYSRNYSLSGYGITLESPIPCGKRKTKISRNKKTSILV